MLSLPSQVLQAHERHSWDLEAALRNQRSGPPQGEGKEAEDKRYAWEHTWASDMNSSQLATELSDVNNVVGTLKGKVKELSEVLISSGDPGLKAEAFASCVMHRLSPRLFPNRPEVSFMIQVGSSLSHFI